MSRWIYMRDFWTVRTKDALDGYKKAFPGKDAKEPNSLFTKVRATTAGIVNGNRRFYRPDRMMESVNTWTPSKPRSPRPVLVGHNDDGAVLGRVLNARYVDESYKYKSEYVQIRDSAFYATDSRKKLDVYKSIDWIVDNLASKEDYAGLGYIELGLNITNPDAIQKVLRDEYLTVSVGFKTDSAICSVCHQDWAADDRCDHQMGEEYDGKQMFLISGRFQYEEVSFVNFPADPFASTVSKDRMADSLSKIFLLGLPARKQNSLGLRFTDSLYASDIRPAEETMPEDTVDPKLAAEIASVAEQDMSKEEQEAAVAEAANAECSAPQLEDIDEPDRAFFADSDKLYEDMWGEFLSAVAEGSTDVPDEFRGQAKDSARVTDAKLSSEKRKGLSGSTFCGPNRSFPVPDCAHVTAARRLIGRAKVGEATKSKILACVSRKAKSLGCGGKSKDKVEAPQLTDRARKIIAAVMKLEKVTGKDATGAEVAKLISELDKAYDSYETDKKYVVRMSVSAMLDDWYADGQMEYYQSQLAAEKDHTLVKKSDLQEKDEALVQAGKDLEAKASEVEIFRKQAAASFVNYKKGLATQIVMFKVLSGDKSFKGLDEAQLREKIKSLTERQVTSLRDTVEDILSELKWIEAPAKTEAEVKTTDAARVETPSEASPAVNDNAQVAEPVPGSSQAADLAGAQRELDLHRARLAAMSPRERTIYVTNLLWKAQAKNPQ